MNEELATMLSKHSKITTREEIVNDFKMKLTKGSIIQLNSIMSVS